MSLIPRPERFPWRRQWQSTPVFLPGKSHAQRSLASYSPWVCKRVRYDLLTKQRQITMQGINYRCSSCAFRMLRPQWSALEVSCGSRDRTRESTLQGGQEESALKAGSNSQGHSKYRELTCGHSRGRRGWNKLRK